MIPIQLTLKNFMSYGEPPVVVPFEGLHVACLSGDNGNGKSAILDGITWALWGRTRGSSVKSVSEDDLIRLGSDEMEVRFEFELSEQRYRVTRKRKRGKAAGSEWHLAAKNEAGAWTAIGGGSQRETGKQIVKLLSMEYDTFLNSAYLQQGRADEFTRQTPDSRKRILGEILGLDRYDRLEEKAKERWRERKEVAEELERQIRMLENAAGRRDEYQMQLEETRAELARGDAELKAQEEKTVVLRDRRSRLDGLADQVAQGEAQLKRMAEEITLREAERCVRIEKLDRLRQVIEQAEAIRSDFANLQRLVARRVLLEPEIEAFHQVTAKIKVEQGVIDIKEKELQGEIRLAEAQAAQAEQKVKDRERLLAQGATLEKELEGASGVEAELARALERQQTIQQEFEELKAANKQCGEELEEIAEVLDLLAHPQAVCPVCESDLSGAKQAKVLARQEMKRAALTLRQRETQQQGRERKQALTAAQEHAAALTRRRDEATARRNRLADVKAQLSALQGVEEEWRRRADQHKLLCDRLAQGGFAAPQRIKRQSLEKEQEKLGLAKAEYETVKQQIARLEPSQRRQQDLEHAERAWEPEQQDLARLEQLIAAHGAERTKAETELKALREKLARHGEVIAAVNAAEADLRRLQEARNRLQVTEGSLLRYLADCEAAEAQRKQNAEQFKQVDEERRMYQALTAAFGKKGVQSLIIENAIPELEEEANLLLARMTDNAMQLHFETTRAAKSGSHEIETLDIKITDDAGARPYELFSGGEAFRINFAVRIALSRLLARRAGAQLQTLIMDEGFGSQDGKGREKLVEVIETIKDDFEKILVITHVEELKDAFAQRIEVTKDAAGSHIHLL